jgi:hypothetical protein
MRIRVTVTAVVIYLFAATSFVQGERSVSASQTSAGHTGASGALRATIADVAWIGGTWVGGGGATTFEERWTPPAGGALLGVARTVKDNRMVAFEFLRIVERNGGLVYIAQPNGAPPTEFTLTHVDAESAVFENPAHDYPKMIRYAKRTDGGLEARISAEGGQRPRTFIFQKQQP